MGRSGQDCGVVRAPQALRRAQPEPSLTERRNLSSHTWLWLARSPPRPLSASAFDARYRQALPERADAALESHASETEEFVGQSGPGGSAPTTLTGGLRRSQLFNGFDFEDGADGTSLQRLLAVGDLRLVPYGCIQRPGFARETARILRGRSFRRRREAA